MNCIFCCMRLQTVLHSMVMAFSKLVLFRLSQLVDLFLAMHLSSSALRAADCRKPFEAYFCYAHYHNNEYYCCYLLCVPK